MEVCRLVWVWETEGGAPRAVTKAKPKQNTCPALPAQRGGNPVRFCQDLRESWARNHLRLPQTAGRRDFGTSRRWKQEGKGLWARLWLGLEEPGCRELDSTQTVSGTSIP